MSTTSNTSPWPSRLAWWAVWVSIPLVALGGSVTTLRAGMAESGWMKPDGIYLWLYPWEKRVQSAGFFVEHHHREFATLVGFLCIGTILAVVVTKRGKSALLTAFIGLAAVGGQGSIGAFRVLKNNPELAFIHGAFGQVVIGVLVGVAVLFSSRWACAPAANWTKPARIRTLSIVVLMALLAQIFLGAWYRHGHGHTAIALHGFLAIALVYAGISLAKRMKRAAKQEGQDPEVRQILRRSAFWMALFFHLQWVLGALALYALFALSDGMHGEEISRGEIIFATLHVTVGAMLIGSVVNAFLWSHRLDTQATS